MEHLFASAKLSLLAGTAMSPNPILCWWPMELARGAGEARVRVPGGRFGAEVVPEVGAVEKVFRGGVSQEEGGPCRDARGHAQGLGVSLELAGQGLPDRRVIGPMVEANLLG
eukprot:1152506-Pelagomonas_calceolata.AAC.1